ncbi:hypothetical protein M9Y10_029951 [Tritrichomonas musculus]|uniref:Uncharacterized protein n=1 Tax=Tritrichomonas musculus TaxID=1915356 RepID=A0ABR2KPF0_9EUKA
MSSDVEDLSPRSRAQYINNKSNETNLKDSPTENSDVSLSSDIESIISNDKKNESSMENEYSTNSTAQNSESESEKEEKRKEFQKEKDGEKQTTYYTSIEEALQWNNISNLIYQNYKYLNLTIDEANKAVNELNELICLKFSILDCIIFAVPNPEQREYFQG